MLSVPAPTRVPVGFATVAGQRVEVYLNPEWARYFDSLNTQVVNTSNAVGQPGAPGTTGAAGVGVSMSDDAGSSMEFIPGPPGVQGLQGVSGPALFMLQETVSEDMVLPALSDSPVFAGTVTAPKFQTAAATATAASGVATTVYSLPNLSAAALYLVHANLGNVADAANYGAYAVIATDGASSRLVTVNNAGLQTITVSGLNVQSTQSSGASHTVFATITRIG